MCYANLLPKWLRIVNNLLSSFQDHKFTSDDFLSFVTSIAGQSPTLSKALLGSHRSLKSVYQSLIPNSHQTFASDFLKTKQAEGMRQPSSIPDGKGEVALDMSAKLVERRKKEAKRRQLDIYPGCHSMQPRCYLCCIERVKHLVIH